MLSTTGWLARTVVRDLQEEVQATDRYVDMSVVLKVVKRDPLGKELIQGKPRMSVVGTSKPYGGVIDTRLEVPRILTDRKVNPTVWFCSEQQLPIILHDSPMPGHLVEGGMGAGKTTSGVMWTYFRWLEHLGQFREGGITAPTNDRLDIVLKEVFGMFPAHWYSYQSSKHLITLADGTRLRGVSTYQQSDAQGSRVQGYNWSWLFGDELQDQIAAFVDAMARLRSGREGGAPRYASATSKDDPAYRDLKEKLTRSGDWSRSRLLGTDSPFVHADHWEAFKRITTDRDYRRLVLAEDLPPESRVYFSWDRKENLRPVPLVGARKITSIVLKRKTGNPRHSLLIGHDPGTAKAASIFLDAFDIRGEVYWWVRGELFTLHKSTEQHALEVMQIARKRFGVNVRADSEIAHVRAQPVGQAEDRPDLDVYRIWSRVGFDIKAAQYKKDGTGTGVIKKDTRIEMVNRLLCDAAGKRRLFIDIDEHGRPVAPKLVEAFETMERDHRGRAEHEEKDEKDPTDSPCALGYALWPFEKESAVAIRADIRKGLA